MDGCKKMEIIDNVAEHVAFTRINNYHSHAPVMVTYFDSPFVAFLVYSLLESLA